MQREQHSRINLGHLKTELVKKLGAERSKLYFLYLNRFLSLKITKVDFDKICFRILGRENIVLHNQLITAILRNAYHATVPPEIHANEVSKPLDAAADYSFLAPSDELQQTRSSNNQAQTLNSSLLSNGSILLPSPRKARSGSRERKLPTSAGGKADILSSHSKEAADASYTSVLEDGNATLSTVGELQRHEVLPEQLRNRGQVVLQYSNKLPVVKGSRDDKSHACIRGSTKTARVEDGTGVSTRSLLQAPLGVPFCAVSKGGGRRALALGSSGGYVSSYDCGGLLDSETLRYSMEQIAVNEGLQCVSLDCANLLNNALDSYLKRLIRSSAELLGKGSGSHHPSNMPYRSPLRGRVANRLWPSNQPQIQSSYSPVDVLQQQKRINTISLLDFKVAMELNPQQLGEDWPVLLERMFD